MKTTFIGKKIEGILTILPQQEILFDEEIKNYSFPEKQSIKLKSLMGYKKHRVVKESSSSSDLCIAGLSKLFKEQTISKEEIGAIIVVTSTPDYQLPGNSYIIHGNFGFSQDVLCYDLMQGCTGYIQGLMLSYMLLEHLKTKKVLLFNVEVLSKKTSKKDRNSYPLIGDAASITVISNDTSENEIFFETNNDGKRFDSLIIPAGGSRNPHSKETSELKDFDNDGNFRSLDNLKMNGTEVFEFVQRDVPGLINSVLEYSKCTVDDIDYMLFHQPNKFMLKKLAQKLEIPFEKIPMNIVENFGNSSGVCIPLNITFNMRDKFKDSTYKCCLSAFGSGLSLGAIVLDLGNMNFCDMIMVDF